MPGMLCRHCRMCPGCLAWCTESLHLLSIWEIKIMTGDRTGTIHSSPKATRTKPSTCHETTWSMACFLHTVQQTPQDSKQVLNIWQKM